MTQNGFSLMMNTIVGFTIAGILGTSFLDIFKEFNILQWIIYISFVLGGFIYGLHYFIRFMKHIDKVNEKKFANVSNSENQKGGKKNE